MSVNDAPLARIRKSISSSSADQIVELFGAPVRTISTPLPIFSRSDKVGSRSGKLWRLASRKQPLTGWAVVQAHAASTVLPLCHQQEGLTARLGCGQGRQDGAFR